MSETGGLRAWVNQHGTIVGAGVITIAVLALIWSRWSVSGPAANVPAHVFFVDELTGDIAIEPVNTIPPIPGNDGRPTLVRAYFYTLGSDAEKQLAYLEKYTDAGKAAAASQAAANEPLRGPPEILVRSPEPGSPWVRIDCRDGERITARLTDAASKPGFRIVMPQ